MTSIASDTPLVDTGQAAAAAGTFLKVAIPLPVTGTFTYSVPEELAERAVVGTRVLVQFGKRKLTGFVVGVDDAPKVENIRSIIDVLDISPVLDEGMIKLTRWVSDYYLAPWGEVVRAALPPGINMESRRFARLTEEGRAALADESAGLSDKKRRVLEVAEGRKRIAVPRLCRESGISRGGHWLVYSLGSAGLLEISEGMTSPRAEPGREPVVALTSAPEVALLEADRISSNAPKQASALRLLAADKERRLSRTKLRACGISSAVVARLVDRGLAETGFGEGRGLPAGDEGWGLRPEGDLTAQQDGALDLIRRKVAMSGFGVVLLHGVTGSGKTRIYREAIDIAVQRGKGAVVLVPEIALTPQMVQNMRRSLGDRVAVVHSGLSLGERHDTWRAVKDGLASVVVGPRSAVFAPVRDLGIIVVDEEHEHTYKQSESPRYHARDVAIMRARLAGAVVVLGTATPSVETYLNAMEGKYALVELPGRIDAGPLPEVEIVDMREQELVDSEGAFSVVLRDGIGETLGEGRQVILFLNRRGYASFIQCMSCGYTARCPNCNVALTFHSSDRSMRCHYCDRREKAPTECPECGGVNLRFGAPGTQRVEKAARELFPDAAAARMDVDTTKRRGSHWRILKDFAEGRTDILLGTQMIAKGLDFPGVGLVGVVMADVGLNLPDFRSGERTFQLLTQVAGRTGRGSERGRVIVQTYVPEHYTVALAREQRYAPFFEREMREREALGYPPFSRLVSIIIKGRDESEVVKAAGHLAAFLCRGADKMKEPGPEVLGPAPAPLERIKGVYRWQILVRGKRGTARALVAAALEQRAALRLPGSVALSIDVDPQEML